MDQDAVARVLVADRSRLIAYIRSMVGDGAAAEDLYQDVLVIALKSCGDIADEKHLLNWARQAARYRAVNYLRRRGRERNTLSFEVIDKLESHWVQLDHRISRERIAALEHCLKKLSTYSQRLLELRYVRGMSGKDVAAVVDREPHAVYTNLSRSYRKLAECIERTLKCEEQA